MMHTLHCYFKPIADIVVKQQDKRLPDPNRSLYQLEVSGRGANDTHDQSTQVQGGESKQPWGSYVKLTSVQQAQTTKYTLANGNYRYSKSIFLIGRFFRT